MIVGLMQPDEGRILFNKDNLYKKTKRRKDIGYVPTEGFLYHSLTVYENLVLIATLFDLNTPYSSRINELAEITGIDKYLHGKVSGLSSGMLKKVLLTAAIIHEPKIIIMDEPFNALDVASYKIFTELIANYEGSILFSSHSPEMVYEIFEKIYIVKNKKIILSSETKNDFGSKEEFSLWYKNELQNGGDLK